MSEEYKTEVIRRCAEANGPCWECPQREECLLWEEGET